MKKTTTIILLFMLSSTAYSQNVDAPILEMLTNDIGPFEVSGVPESRVIDDGTTRVTGTYTYGGDMTVDFKVGILTDEVMEKATGELSEIMTMFREMGESGKMEVKNIEEEGLTGIFNVRNERGGIFFLAHEKYLFDISIQNAEGMSGVIAFFDLMDFSGLKSGSSGSSSVPSQQAQAKAKPNAEEVKMIRMLTDSYGSFNAAGDATIGEGSVVSRSYKSGDKTFTLKIESLEPGAKSTKSNRIKKLREKYKSAELVRIDKEKLVGNLIYDGESKKGLIYLMVRGEHWIVGTINNASGIDDVKSIYGSFDYSLLK